MKMTHLDMVQSILSSLNSDEVNSYSDTTESMQVSEILRTTFFNMVSRADLPETKQIVQLDASIDSAIPVLMYKPNNVDKIYWIKYYNSDPGGVQGTDDSNFIHDLNLDIDQTGGIESPGPPAYQYVRILPVKTFLDMINKFNPTESNVETYTFNEGGTSFNFLLKDDKQPQYCTAIQNKYILFDSFDKNVDDTLQTSKTLVSAQIIPTYTLSDLFIPPIDDYQFPLLLNEAKSLAFLELKQTPHSKAEQETRRQWSQVQKNKSLTDRPSYFNQLPNFGRQGGGFV